MIQRELDLWNPTPEQKALDNARIILSKKRSRKLATLDLAHLVMNDRLRTELSFMPRYK